MARGRYPEPESNHGVGNGGQGRNRTIDTRIFSSSESPVRREQGDESERVFDRPTEPPRPTEPIPNPGRGGRPTRDVSSRNARGSGHCDRAATELRAETSARQLLRSGPSIFLKSRRRESAVPYSSSKSLQVIGVTSLPNRALSSRRARTREHRDRTWTELGTSRPAFGRDGDQSDCCRNTRMSCAVASSCRWFSTVVSKRFTN